MGFPQARAALRIQLPPGPKGVLNVLAFYACELCGHARPGVALLMLNTGLGERAVRQALEDLRGRPELLRVYRYPKGGRGVTTEYIVMPEVAKVSTADCRFLELHTKTLHHAQGKAPTGSGNPARKGSKTLHQTQDHPSVQPHPSSSAAPNSAEAAPDGTASAGDRSATGPHGPGVEPPHPTPPLSEPPNPPTAPRTPEEARAFVRDLAAKLHLRNDRTGRF